MVPRLRYKHARNLSTLLIIPPPIAGPITFRHHPAGLEKIDRDVEGRETYLEGPPRKPAVA